jgi:hypothetical protein
MALVRGLNSDGSVKKQIKNFYELSVWISRLHKKIYSCNQAINLTSEGRLYVIELINGCKCLILPKSALSLQYHCMREEVVTHGAM